MASSSSPTTGPDFVSLQVRDLAASADFYERVVGLARVPAPNPQAVVFTSGTSSFAVRTPLPGFDLDAHPQLGAGVGIWFHHPDALAVHRRVVDHGAAVVQEPSDGPFGTTFAFRDPDGYAITIHSKA